MSILFSTNGRFFSDDTEYMLFFTAYILYNYAPAGADLSSLVEADGTIQIEKLAAAYGTTDVR